MLLSREMTSLGRTSADTQLAHIIQQLEGHMAAHGGHGVTGLPKIVLSHLDRTIKSYGFTWKFNAVKHTFQFSFSEVDLNVCFGDFKMSQPLKSKKKTQVRCR